MLAGSFRCYGFLVLNFFVYRTIKAITITRTYPPSLKSRLSLLVISLYFRCPDRSLYTSAFLSGFSCFDHFIHIIGLIDFVNICCLMHIGLMFSSGRYFASVIYIFKAFLPNKLGRVIRVGLRHVHNFFTSTSNSTKPVFWSARKCRVQLSSTPRASRSAQ